MNRRRHRVDRLPKLCVLAGLCLLIPAGRATSAAADDPPGETFVNRVYEDEHGPHKYAVFVPKNYTPDRPWPVIVYLHGASARGRDGRAPLVSGVGPNVFQRRDTFPFLVVFPQCENLQSRLLGGWTDEPTEADRALKILADAERHYRIDPDRRILAGVSMGAFGVWSVAARTPQLWSALVPVSGGGPLSIAENLQHVPVWAFHAADDQVVPPTASSHLVQAVRSHGGAAYYSELPNGGHNIGSRVFAKDEVYEWLVDPQQPPRLPADWSINPGAVAQLQDEVRFVPGAEIDRAVHVHVGSDLMEALAHALPAQIPAESLQGLRGPQAQQTGSGWMRFQVVVAGVQYAGQVQEARIEPLGDNQLRLRMGLSPLTMTVLGTRIQGRLLRAQAGAMQAVIGVRRPAWLNVVVRPRIEARQLKLDLVSADFPIEPDNWYVTEPNGIDVFPLPMLRDRVAQRLTDGLYAQRGEIERQVVAGVPKLLEEIEHRVQTQTDRVLTFGRWPMPVWQPRAKLWPSDVTIDAGGMTLTMGITLAAVCPQTETVEIRRHPPPDDVPNRPAAGVQISVANDVIQAWTDLLAASDVRSFHVQDFHAEAFHRLADRDFLSQVMPALNSVPQPTELRSILSFEQPMFLEPMDGDPDGSTAGVSNRFRLGGRELKLTISSRQPGEDWLPLAEFPLAWSQDFRIRLEKASHTGRKVLLESLSPPDVVADGRWLAEPARFAARPELPADAGLLAADPLDMNPPDERPARQARPESVVELHGELVANQFRQGWESTFATAFAKQIALPERVIAEIPLACEAIGMEGRYLVIQLRKPTTQIQNLSRDPVTYEIRGPGTGWSLPQVLPPGMMHEYQAAGPLTWRHQNLGKEYLFTLPVGSVSHFRGGEEQPLWLVPQKPPADLVASPPPTSRQR